MRGCSRLLSTVTITLCHSAKLSYVPRTRTAAMAALALAAYRQTIIHATPTDKAVLALAAHSPQSCPYNTARPCSVPHVQHARW
eukprot:228450-Chlamydomonas_euryale.AAC.13